WGRKPLEIAGCHLRQYTGRKSPGRPLLPVPGKSFLPASDVLYPSPFCCSCLRPVCRRLPVHSRESILLLLQSEKTIGADDAAFCHRRTACFDFAKDLTVPHGIEHSVPLFSCKTDPRFPVYDFQRSGKKPPGRTLLWKIVQHFYPDFLCGILLHPRHLLNQRFSQHKKRNGCS